MKVKSEDEKQSAKNGLPLDWTRINDPARSSTVPWRRPSPAVFEGEQNLTADTTKSNKRKAPASLVDLESDPSISENPENLGVSSLTSPPSHEQVQGTVFFLLPTINPPWFQGYFLPKINVDTVDGSWEDDSVVADKESDPQFDISSGGKPWGLLLEQIEIDDCLACDEGGYRQVKMTIYFPRRAASNSEDRPKYAVPQVLDWTGGDMIQLIGSAVEVLPQNLWTGQAAVPFIQSIFRPWLDQGISKSTGNLSKSHHNEKTNSGASKDSTDHILEEWPDVAVVRGSMNVLVPSSLLPTHA
jgi:hypothetical protein